MNNLGVSEDELFYPTEKDLLEYTRDMMEVVKHVL